MVDIGGLGAGLEACGPELSGSGSGQGPVVVCCVHGNETSGAIEGENLLNELITVSFSRRTWLHGISRLDYQR